jgi:uncharacterized protein DUF4389
MVMTPDANQPPLYPVRLWMEYPERLSRLATFFRIILIIPVLIFLALVGGGSLNFDTFSNSDEFRNGGSGGAFIGGSVIVAIWATIVLRRNIPHWLFDFQVGLNRFSYRAYAYFALLTDKYPPFEGDWHLQYWVEYPESLSRWKVLFWKIITALPHFLVLAALMVASVVVIIIAWFAILFSGKYPQGLHAFVVGVLRWQARVGAYVESLTDVFPPFSLEHEAGPASKGTETLCAVIGGVLFAAIVAGVAVGVTFLVIFLSQEKSRDVPLSDVIRGDVAANVARIEMDDVTFMLVSGDDPATVPVLAARPGRRLVQFTIEYQGDAGALTFGGAEEVGNRDLDRDSLRLETDDDSSIDPVLLTFDGVAAPVELDDEAAGTLNAIFEIGDDDAIEELRAYPDDGSDRHVAWQFE